ncbi:hypothetical protein FSARC_11108 [Fusarium sarcochroum]|uniref:Uncharacterized protein n=1 Tax=Fusarium sarcochroum TaxID=1208366 RepID=A0A8H4THL8_9HYPO|nr:hypothetical protein FSARC_11108 [Fusarium sarcochroum]
MSDSLQDQLSYRSQATSGRVYEIPEYMVRELDGRVHPALMAIPGSGVVYRGSESWVAESQAIECLNFDQIYASAINAQSALITTANKLCTKKKLPSLDLTVAHSWSEVDESVSNACKVLEVLSTKDKALKPGFTGKLRQGFRKICSNAGVGTTLANLVPTDSYCSVLCGGLKIIFKALEETGHYREEVGNALEAIPFILSDKITLVKLNNMDEELHRRVAAIYAAIYALLEVIVGWFLKSSLRTGARIFSNPSGFSDKLKTQRDTVDLAVQRFNARVDSISAVKQEGLAQQNLTIMYGLDHHAEAAMRRFDGIETRLMTLDNLEKFFYETWKAGPAQRQAMPQPQATPRIKAPAINIEDILVKWLYEPDLVYQDCTTVLRLQHIAGYDVDPELVSTVKFHPRFQSFLALDKSSLIFVDMRSENPAGSLEMPIIAAEMFQTLASFIEKHESDANDATTRVICLSFLCSRHKDMRRDANANPTELMMSLVLQLLDHYRGFDSEHLDLVSNHMNPSNVETVLFVFEALLSQLPENVLLYLIIDDLRTFTQPVSRKYAMVQVVQDLLAIHRDGEYTARLKFFFGNSARNEFSDGFFTEDETLRIWSPQDGSYSS